MKSELDSQSINFANVLKSLTPSSLDGFGIIYLGRNQSIIREIREDAIFTIALQNGNSIVEESNKNEKLEQARALFKEGRHDSCLETIREYWLDNPRDKEAVEIVSRLMKEAEQIEIAGSLEKLIKTVKDDDNGSVDLEKVPEITFEVGYKLIDIREYELAEMLLKTCVSATPDDPTVHYELGFTMMSQAKYDLAARHFELVRKLEEDFDTVLNLSACYTLGKQFDKSKELISQLEVLANTEEEKYELKHRRCVLKRQESLKKKAQMTTRDWLYILYGTILLFDDEEESSPPEKQEREAESFRETARSLLVLKGVLEGLRLEPEAIEFYSPTSRPLASILARLFDIPLSAYKGPDRPDHALILMDWAPEIIGPHKSFIPNDGNRSMFAYGIPSNMPLPLIPDVVAHVKDSLLLPWKGESQATFKEEEAELTPEDAIPEILEKAFNLESDPDVLRVIHDSIAYYVDKRELLVISNNEAFPHRPEYSAEIPSRTRRNARNSK